MADDIGQFPRLFQPFRLGPMLLRNRIVLPPMGINAADKDGTVTQEVLDYYEKRARGGAGLIIVEGASVDLSGGRVVTNQLGIDDDKHLPGLRELARVIQKAGARAAIQMHHAGRATSQDLNHKPLVAPSPLPAVDGTKATELTEAEIHEISARFASAAARAREAGFDAVEFHSASNYLPYQFLAARWNQREDGYGGSVEKRGRFLRETLQAIRGAVGQGYPMWVRLNSVVFGDVDPGYTPEDAVAFAKMAEREGVIAIHTAAFSEGIMRKPPSAAPKGGLLPLTEALKKTVRVPVIASGRIDAETGEAAISEGKADLISIGRALIADPDLPNKVRDGKQDDVRPCILCNHCTDVLHPGAGAGQPLECTINPSVLREREFTLVRTTSPSRILVIGGGPAGLETAAVAAMRGHDVTLWEKEGRLGGQLNYACLPPYKDTLKPLLDYLVRRAQRSGVKIELDKEATAASIKALRPQMVVLAAGAAPFVPEIPGVDGPTVVGALDVLEGKTKAGKRVAIIGGELVGCETADFLMQAGHTVTVLRRGPQLATHLAASRREGFLGRLAHKGVKLMPGVQYRKITPKGVEVVLKDGRAQTVPADTVVIAAGALPNSGLNAALRLVSQVFVVGDAVKPRGIREAITEGAEVGLRL